MSFVTPASASACELTQALWPSMAIRNDGNVRPDGVQVLLAGAGRGKGAIAPAETADDVHVADLVAIGPERVEQSLAACRTGGRAARDGGADERMDVPLDEARQKHLPCEIHHAGLRPDEGLHACVVADEDDALALDRHGAGPGLARPPCRPGRFGKRCRRSSIAATASAMNMAADEAATAVAAKTALLRAPDVASGHLLPLLRD